jgi:uncharacterized glyoxalase superfamily protein PhnB
MREGHKKHIPVNESEVYELQIYTENDADIYRQRLVPIYKNLSRKISKRIYKHELGIKAMRYAVDDANRKYKKEYGVSFSTSVRYRVAKNMTKAFEKEFKAGNRW